MLGNRQNSDKQNKTPPTTSLDVTDIYPSSPSLHRQHYDNSITHFARSARACLSLSARTRRAVAVVPCVVAAPLSPNGRAPSPAPTSPQPQHHHPHHHHITTTHPSTSTISTTTQCARPVADYRSHNYRAPAFACSHPPAATPLRPPLVSSPSRPKSSPSLRRFTHYHIRPFSTSSSLSESAKLAAPTHL